MEISSMLPVSVIYLFNWLPKCACFACLCSPQCFSCFHHLNNYKVISQYVSYPHDTFRLHKQAFAKHVSALCPKITIHGNVYCWCCHNFKLLFSKYWLSLFIMQFKISVWMISLFLSKRQISPSQHFTSLISSEHNIYFILSLSMWDVNY